MKKTSITTVILCSTLLASLTSKAQLFASSSNLGDPENNIRRNGVYENVIQFNTPVDLISPEMNLTKLNNSINTGFLEMGPLVSPDGKTIYFSRYNPSPDQNNKDTQEDIWYSQWDEQKNTWGQSKNIGQPLNNENPNYINSISPDGNTILLGNTYFSYGKMKNGLSISHRTNDGWSFPENLKIDGENKCFNWAGCYLSNSGNVLIIACQQKKNNFGNRDLYISVKKSDNTWTKPSNLGPVINSEGSESAPFLSQDEKTIFYTSDGLGGFGGSDIFMATRTDNGWLNWSRPQNLGSKINSPRDESFFCLSPTDNKVYFSSESDLNGDMDIYTLILPETSVTEPALENFIAIKEIETSDKLAEANTPVIFLAPLFYQFNKAKLNSNEKELEKLIKILVEDPTIKIEITGHTDNLGSKVYNKKLSYKRAKLVADFLLSNGLSNERIMIKNLGSDNPIGDNTSKEGRALNRRVEFKLIRN